MRVHSFIEFALLNLFLNDVQQRRLDQLRQPEVVLLLEMKAKLCQRFD